MALQKQDSSVVTTLSERIIGETGQKLSVLHGTITSMVADAVVHPSAGGFSFGGQVGSALMRKGGRQLSEAIDTLRQQYGSIPSLGAVAGPAFNIKASNIIHVNGPSHGGTKCHQDMETQIHNLLNLAEREKYGTIALPCIGSGNAGWPKQEAAQTILRAIHMYLRGTPNQHLKTVIFVLFDKETLEIYRQELGKLPM